MIKNEGDKLLYKASEVASMLGITNMTLKKLVLSKKIAAVTINTHRYFKKDEVERFIADSMVVPEKTEGRKKQ